MEGGPIFIESKLKVHFSVISFWTFEHYSPLKTDAATILQYTDINLQFSLSIQGLLLCKQNIRLENFFDFLSLFFSQFLQFEVYFFHN